MSLPTDANPAYIQQSSGLSCMAVVVGGGEGGGRNYHSSSAKTKSILSLEGKPFRYVPGVYTAKTTAHLFRILRPENRGCSSENKFIVLSFVGRQICYVEGVFTLSRACLHSGDTSGYCARVQL